MARDQTSVRVDKHVETVNSLSPEIFFATFCADATTEPLVPFCSKHKLAFTLANASTMINTLTKGCFDLIEETSAEDYKSSELKWSPAKKKKEMALPDMKYIALYKNDPNSTEQKVAGFVSFMITYENSYDVLYVYELHLAQEWRSRGLGKLLMNIVEHIGQAVVIDKIMLTVFKANDHAVRWYHHLGYGEDEFSPAPRKLRNGTVKAPSYIILSKAIE